MSAMDKKFYCARIYVTHQCNSHCKYCDTHDEIYKDIKEMSLKQSKELIRQLRNVGVEYIDFTGGEPTLNKNLPEIISFANEIGIKTEVTTNATTGLTDILIQSAKRARKFNISLDTIKPQRYFSIRGVDKLQVVSETVKAVSKIRSDLNLTVPKLMTVVTEENLDDLPELIEFATINNLEIYLNPVFSFIRYKEASSIVMMARTIIMIRLLSSPVIVDNCLLLVNVTSLSSPDVSWDGKEILFCWTPGEHRVREWDEMTTFHIMKMKANGDDLEMLTWGGVNDLFPCWLPNGRVIFCSERRGGYESINDRSADRCDVDYPSYCCSAQERDEERNDRYQSDGICRRALAAEPGDPIGQHRILRKSVHEAAQSHNIAYETRNDYAQERYHKYAHAGIAEIVISGIERRQPPQALQLTVSAYIIKP